MRIGIDARMLFMSGIGTYLRNLLGGLASLDEDIEYTVFIQTDDNERFEPPGKNFSPSLVSAAPYSISEQVGFVRRIEGSGLDLIHHLGASLGKVRLTYNALPRDWGKSVRPEPPPGMGDGTPFFLYVGNHKTHKNIPLLLEAFAEVRKRLPAVRLALTGEREGLEQDMASFHLGDEVVFLGDVSHERLEGIYAAARALVFPSSYEGFGYPPLEAMGCGTPAIVSDAAALPEVVGEAGLIVPVGEVAPLRDAMMRLLEDDALRASLSEKARARAAQFSLRALAEDTLKAYRDVLSPKEAG
jgi:glycosyltransferase involved in cell wall biosynthesis